MPQFSNWDPGTSRRKANSWHTVHSRKHCSTQQHLWDLLFDGMNICLFLTILCLGVWYFVYLVSSLLVDLKPHCGCSWVLPSCTQIYPWALAGLGVGTMTAGREMVILHDTGHPGIFWLQRKKYPCEIQNIPVKVEKHIYYYWILQF